MSDVGIHYKASPTLSAFHQSRAFYRFLIGPVGSGKSTGCSVELFRRGQEQYRGPDGLRKTRWAVSRNTYRELEDTTLKTWLDWWKPELFGKMNYNDMVHIIRYKDVEMEVLFRALDTPKDVKKLLSLELTGAWMNEVREMPKSIIDGVGDRVGRYPPVRDGGCAWRGVIGDSNAPDTDHWIYRMAEEEKPTGWDFFKQPGGLIERGGKFLENPQAENLENIEPHYYLSRMAGKSLDHIRVYYCAQYGYVQEGKPVIPEYVDALHCSNEIIEPNPRLILYIGLDFGLTPAAVFGQKMANGRDVWIDELVTEDMGAVNFGKLLKQKIFREYRNFMRTDQNPQGAGIVIVGDPAGEQRSQTDERTPFEILNHLLKPVGLEANKASTNDFTIRREAIAVPLGRIIDGKPGLMISPKCIATRKGLRGAYCYKRLEVSGEERFRDVPVKNKYSHPVEAGGYMQLEMGEGDALVHQPSNRNRTVTSVLNNMPLSGGW
jgi:hypothetical protein